MIKEQKNIIFDLGAVMVDWNPHAIAKNFTTDSDLQNTIVNHLFHHNDWSNFDNGLISENELIKLSSKRLSISIYDMQQLMHQAKESLHSKNDMVMLLQLAKKQGLRTFCLSNLSHEWFTYLRQRHDFFTLFEGQVISAQEGIGKPSIEIYQRTLDRYNIQANQTLFVDDRSDNTEAAASLGINCITFEHTEQDLDAIKHFVLTPLS